jgi:hypothetical protein
MSTIVSPTFRPDPKYRPIGRWKSPDRVGVLEPTAIRLATCGEGGRGDEQGGPEVMPQRKPADAKSPDRVFHEITGLVDAFCKQHLNAEYAELCCKLTEKLARKRPSPLLAGKPQTWACGIVRTIGWVNFLDDASQKLHMKLTAIDKAFGVGESTGQGKAMLIRKMMKIGPMDPAWSLRRRIDQNPMNWMIHVDGFLVDARFLKREIQEEALRKGLIPFIPERPQPIKEDDD